MRDPLGDLRTLTASVRPKESEALIVAQRPSLPIRAASTRLARTFAGLRLEGRLGLIAYLTAGFPELSATQELIPALLEGGVDVVELGVPFSDPLADGPTIQRASQRALEQGVTPQFVLDQVSGLRRRGVTAPLLLMGYYNPILAYGLERFGQAAQKAGVDGLIVPDLPPEEAGDLVAATESRAIDVIRFLAPTTTEERMAKVCALATGFIYCVSLTGVTGARDSLPAELPGFLRRVRASTALPIAVGFGISRPEHVAAVRNLADAVIVGSALIDAIERAPPTGRAAAARDLVAQLRTATACD